MKKEECVMRNYKKTEQINELLDYIQEFIEQACLRHDDKLDSRGMSSYADGIRLLAKYGRVKILSEYGRVVVAEIKEEG